MDRNKNKAGEPYFTLSLEESHQVARELQDLIKEDNLSDREMGFVVAFRNNAMEHGHQFSTGSINWVNRILRANDLTALKRA